MSLVLRPYQINARDWLSTKKWGIVKAPAASGKTLMAAAALDKVLSARVRTEKVKVGWLANTIEQCQQANEAIKAFPSLQNKIEITIACAMANTDWSDRAVLIVDECHHAPCDLWSTQILKCAGARWGFSATPPEDPELYKQFLDIFGGNVFTISRDEVKHSIVEGRIVMLTDTDPDLEDRLNFQIDLEVAKRKRWWRRDEISLLLSQLSNKQLSENEKSKIFGKVAEIHGILWGMVAWQAIIDLGMVENRLRNQAIIRKAIEHRNDSVIVLVNSVDHGKALSLKIPDSIACSSKMGKKKREKALEDFKSGKCKCLIATSLLDEGANLPIANILILAGGGKSNAKNEQRTGRVLRTFKEKTHGLIYDFKDLFHPLAAKHSRKRVELYHRLGYSIK